jgi:hypothetical protein
MPKSYASPAILLMQKEAYLNDMLHEKPVTITINCEPDNKRSFGTKS